jgi:hypothetical protein
MDNQHTSTTSKERAMSRSIKIHSGLALKARCADVGLQPSERQARMFKHMDKYNHHESYQYSDTLLRDFLVASSKHTWGLRAPVTAELTAAVLLAQRADEINIAGDTVTETFHELPPGDIRFEQLVDQRVQLSRGHMPHAEAFSRTEIAHAPRTQIKAGVALDISGSMAHMAALGSSLAWVVGSAIQRLDGQVATVAFSNEVYPLVAPSEQQDSVAMTGTSAGNHRFAEAQQMLDGALDLTDGDGARLLVVFSDAEFFDPDETKYLGEATKAGVHVVWLTPHDLHPAQPMPPRGEHFSVVSNVMQMDYAEIVATLGDVLVASVAKARGVGV